MFSFKFQSVLTLRDYEEKQQKQKLASLIDQSHQLAETIAQQRLALQKKNKQAHNAQSSSREERFLGKYILIQSQRLDQLMQEKEQLGNEIHTQRNVVLACNRKRKILQKLKAKAYSEYVEEQNYKEQLFLNELATQNYINRHR